MSVWRFVLWMRVVCGEPAEGLPGAGDEAGSAGELSEAEDGTGEELTPGGVRLGTETEIEMLASGELEGTGLGVDLGVLGWDVVEVAFRPLPNARFLMCRATSVYLGTMTVDVGWFMTSCAPAAGCTYSA